MAKRDEGRRGKRRDGVPVRQVVIFAVCYAVAYAVAFTAVQLLLR